MVYCYRSSNGPEQYMIETLFQIKGKVEAHMSAPLLQERESFLAKKQSEGNGIRSLQMTADQLLFATLHLPLTNVTATVGLPDILSMQRVYDGPKSNFLVSTVVQWLEDIGLLDPKFNDQSILFNRFSSVCHYKMRYLAYPFYEERLSYLKNLESRGMSFSRLHEYAWMQISIIDRLCLDGQDNVCESDIEKVITDIAAEDCSKRRVPSQKWIKTFKTVAYGWLSYAGMLHREQESNPPEHKVWYTTMFNGLGITRVWPIQPWKAGSGNSSASCLSSRAGTACYPYRWSTLMSIWDIVITADAAGVLWQLSLRP